MCYHQDERDRAVGLGCMGLTVIAFMFLAGALVSAIEAVARLWT